MFLHLKYFYKMLGTIKNLIFLTGDELGMMEDALVAYSDLANVSFRVYLFISVDRNSFQQKIQFFSNVSSTLH